MADLFSKLETLYFDEAEMLTVLRIAKRALEDPDMRGVIWGSMALTTVDIDNLLSTLTDIVNTEG